MAYSIHDILKVHLINPSKENASFLKEELWNFEKEVSSVDLTIKFVDKITLPEGFIYLKYDLAYKDGIFYFLKDGILEFPIKDIAKSHILVRAEKNIIKWHPLFVIEKVLSLKAIEKGYSLFHCAGLEEKDGVNLYLALGASGKTGFAIQKLFEGAKFLGEEYILVKEDTAYAYPRGMNIHRFMGEDYEKLKSFPTLKKDIYKEILFLKILEFLTFICPFKILKRLIKRSAEGKRFIRTNIRKFLPEAKILEKGRIKKIHIFFKGKSKPVFCNWDKERFMNFILWNNHIEKRGAIGLYLDAFWAYGDEYSKKTRQYFEELLIKERKIIEEILKCVSF